MATSHMKNTNGRVNPPSNKVHSKGTNTYRSRKSGAPYKIHEALELLNEAAKDKKEELFKAIETQYEDVRDVFEEASTTGKAVIRHAKKAANQALNLGKKKIKIGANDANQRVHENAWIMIGVSALAAFLVGYNASRNKF